ncbi:MAG: sulfatase-like hydrolase/transferase [Planctomycetes bacterium]|nr:sulfatase-like hydrolase/transferase [Planctomycetota bacterium]
MNVVFILSDQHNPFFSGCYGHPLAETPNIDRMAVAGTRFEKTYCLSPLCVPTRGAMFAGRYVHEIGTWCNSTPWDGRSGGWGHYFRDSGVLLTTVGKLDFMADRDHGVEREIMASHRSSFDVHSLYREQPVPVRWLKKQQMDQSGPRDDLTIESFHDWDVAVRSAEWLENERPSDRPWVLNVNFSEPHPGWPCPPDLWDKWNSRVSLDDLSEKYFEPVEKLHPYHQEFARHQVGAFSTDEEMRRGHAAYLAHCEIVDTCVGHVLEALDHLGIIDETLVIYAADHGENCMAHRMWGKMNQYEDSIRVPLIFMGPGVRQEAVESSPVSQLDIFPTVAEAVGLERPPDFRGMSLMPLCHGDAGAPRHDFVLSEFHANGAPAGMFSISDGRYKYVECVGERPMLFDLENDPQELDDLIVSAPDRGAVKDAVVRARRWFCNICSPQAVDVRAKHDQAVLRAELERSGQLVKEIEKRGYKPRTDALVPRDDVVPEGYTPDGKLL